MKYLKCFELLDLNNFFYKRLSSEEFIGYSNSKYIKFTSKEFNEIKKVAENYRLSAYIDNYLSYDVIETGLFTSGYLRIWKLEDEWYLIDNNGYPNYTHIYYICDQFEGLIKFLENIYG